MTSSTLAAEGLPGLFEIAIPSFGGSTSFPPPLAEDFLRQYGTQQLETNIIAKVRSMNNCAADEHVAYKHTHTCANTLIHTHVSSSARSNRNDPQGIERPFASIRTNSRFWAGRIRMSIAEFDTKTNDLQNFRNLGVTIAYL